MPRSALLEAPLHVRRVGYRTSAAVLGEQLWAERRFLGLRCDLTRLPDVRRAGIELRMQPVDPPGFDGFAEAARTTPGRDHVELLLRCALCRDGVEQLYVASGPDGTPAYAQWLVRASDQERLHAHAPGRYDRLAGDEVLLEGAYTFAAYRRLGAMADGMMQLLRIARDEGARSAITYVGEENVASLRGCAAVGFDADHLHTSIRRLGLRRTRRRALDGAGRAAWTAATAPAA